MWRQRADSCFDKIMAFKNWLISLIICSGFSINKLNYFIFYTYVFIFIWSGCIYSGFQSCIALSDSRTTSIILANALQVILFCQLFFPNKEWNSKFWFAHKYKSTALTRGPPNLRWLTYWKIYSLCMTMWYLYELINIV